MRWHFFLHQRWTDRVFLCAVLLFWNCHGQKDGPAVARVGKAVLTLRTLEEGIPETISQQISAEEKREMVERWVKKQLLYQEARRRGLEKDPLVRKWVEQAEIDIVVNALIKREMKESQDITEADIARYYEEHRGEFARTSAEIRARSIQVENSQKAIDIHKRLSSGASLEKILAEGSSTGIRSGDLGYFTQGDVDNDLWSAVSILKVGAFSRPVYVNSGYHILQVLDRKEAGTPRNLEEVRGRIMDLLVFERQKERVDQLTQQLRSRIRCEIHPELLSHEP